MYKSLIKYICIVLIPGFITQSIWAQDIVKLGNSGINLEWGKENNGYILQKLQVKTGHDWKNMEPAKYQHTILYSPVKPDATPQKLYDNAGKEISFPDSIYRYLIPLWKQSTTGVALNTAGEKTVYTPTTYNNLSASEIKFQYENDQIRVEQKWGIHPSFPNDIKVTITLHSKQAGYYSIASPSLVSIDKYDFTWATIPGLFQGNSINPDFVRAYAYGQGIPDKPVIMRERAASTLAALITDKQGITIAVTAEPGAGRDPWVNDQKTHSDWELGLSVMNRDGEFSPTLYHPVLGEKGSYIEKGESLSFSFRYTIQEAGWHTVFKHAVNDIYRFADFLKLKETTCSLTDRLYRMHKYLVNDSTSKWHTYSYQGVTIGAQDYLGGVYNSEKDASKNSDYGAMWMLAKMTNDPLLTKNRLPYALNFKLMQQETEGDFFRGVAAGQYYLHKSKRFTEEWGPYTEPIGTTYYMLMDMGNILLFEPHQKKLKQHVKLAADKLLEWMKPDGCWEVGYDNTTTEPIFTDIEDLRPTFYGLLIAWQILKEEKYLNAAIKGADWYIENAVKKGKFLGVCGDTRFVPDFATIQSVQALLEMYEETNDSKYQEAAIETAKIYTASVYTHPIPSTTIKQVKGQPKADWEISQVGLSFEHGGLLGSANHHGPILLASHAGLFVRLYTLTNDSLFLNMARAAAIGRDAFVDQETAVASYYWDAMNRGAGPFPHHAWWQVGWITDYLLSEATLRSGGKISNPRGFITPKVGPHQMYGFAPGSIYGTEASLIMRPELFHINNPYIEYITAINEKEKTLFLILMNNDDDLQNVQVKIKEDKLFPGKKINIKNVQTINSAGSSSPISERNNWSLQIDTYGIKVLKIQY